MTREATPPTVELLEPREVPLGGQRAMLVRRTLPHKNIRTIGAWCFVDDYGPADIAGTDGMQVPPHPHTGLQTVSWLLEGDVLHRDSLGSQQRIEPGQLNLMTAGSGIAHAEQSPETRASDALRGVQLWVALPDDQRHAAPAFDHHADLPVVEDDSWRATVLLGSFDGVESPARAFTPIVGAEVRVDAGEHRLPLDRAFEHGLLALDEGLAFDGLQAQPGSMVYLDEERPDVAVSAASAGRLLLLGGIPLDEELLMWWNFVARDHDEIVEMRTAWMQAVEGADTRFGQVTAYEGPSLPAPAMPMTRLRARPGRRT
ncbi:MAG: pirin family protein [Candidatus Nanopelagicales bacterium]